ncbi:MAG: 2-hydroxyacid dehydrogenase [bacterium]|jgi:gluconate 2-dehydrogenase|nr:D-glycerate dehydrogenase [Betaproteobacteria bacterium]
MAHKVVVTREVFDDALDRLRAAAIVVDNQGDVPLPPAELAARAADADAIVCALTDRVDAALLARCPRLKVVANIAVGYNNIDLAACTARGVMATNTPGVLDETTADFAWTLMLGAARRITEAERYLREGQWTGWQLKQLLGVDVHHATLGIIGMGRIGQAIARRATGFSMQVLYCNRSRLDAEVERGLNARWVARDELLAAADFVVLMVPYSEATHHLIGAAELARMKPTAVLVNTARGGVVDDVALVDALRRRVIAAAGIDVFEGEPAFHRDFLALDNVVLAPHIASSSAATRRAMAMLAARNAIAALSGERPPNLLNPQVLQA